MMLDKGELGCDDESYRALIEKAELRPDRFWPAVWLLREGHTTTSGLCVSSAKTGSSRRSARSVSTVHKAGVPPLSGCSRLLLIDCSAKTARFPRALLSCSALTGAERK